MQRGTSHVIKPPSVASSRGDTASSRANAVRIRGLESPGDTSPPGIQFSRGSFSDHLLPLDSPPSTGIERRGPVPAASTKTPSLLRSPTRKRPPPAPAAAPRPPTSVSSSGARASSSILMPPKTPRSQPSPLTRVSKDPGAGTTRVPSPTSPPVSPKTTTASHSVNPVDALVKKLRQQATELTQVYEQMEKKDAELDNLRGDMKQLQMQADMQRTRQRATSVSSAPRSVVKKVSSGIAPSRPTNGISRANASVSKQVHTVPSSLIEEQASEDAAIAMRRMEEALTELRQCHHELLGYCASTGNEKDPLSSADVQYEQHLYIRVLEEAVHLKASELRITGHEELLVVLAELRHTIYQQEQELGELQQQLNKTKGEHLDCTTVRLELEDTLQRERSKWEQENVAVRQRETALQRQLEDVQRLAHTEHMRFREERATQDEMAKRLASLEKDLGARTLELREWETIRNDGWAQKETRMTRYIEELKTSLESEQSESSRSREALDKSQRQVDELKTLQEGLLQSIDQFVSKEDQFERQIKQLDVEAASARQLRRENESLQTSNSELRQEVEQTRIQSAEQQEALQSLDAVTEVNRLIKDALCAKTANINATSDDRELVVDDLSFDDWIQTLGQVVPTSSSSLPWLATLVEDMTSRSPQLRRVVEEYKEKYEQLKESTTAFEQTIETGASELKRLHAELLEAQTELIQSQIETQKLQFRVSTMEEEAREAQAQLHLRDTLAEQIFQQENLLKTQQQRLYSTLEQINELMELETEQANQLIAKEQEISRLRYKVHDYERQQAVFRELEHELEEAASLAEQQNSWNQQLTVELEHLELAKAEQDQLVETMEIREEAVSSRFVTLFSKYIQFVAANKQRLKEAHAIETMPGNQGTPSVYDDALGSGDVLQMLRVFPTLVEEYLASVMLGIQGRKADDRQGTRPGRLKQREHATHRSLLVPVTRGRDEKQTLWTSGGTTTLGPQDDEDPLGVQLHEIAVAFDRFKTVQ